MLTYDGAEPIELGLALICNTDPWTYLGGRPVRPCPDADFSSGLDLFGMTGIPTLAVLRHLAQLLAVDSRPKGKRVVLLHDLPWLALTSTEPLPFQLDGDFVGDRTAVRLTAVPEALQVAV